MATWTAADIEAKIRATTGRPDANMMSSAEIYDRMNKYYQLVLPKELKIFFGYTYYNFLTQPNIDTYVPSSDFQTYNPQIYFDGFPGDWYLSPDLFFQDYPIETNKQVVGTGDGTTTLFTFTCPAFPVLPGSLYVTDGIQTAQDNSVGGFIGPVSSGSVNYITGSVSLTWNTPPAANSNITVSYQTYQANRPQGLLYYDNVFVLRPVPDNVYRVKMEGIRIPKPLVNPSDVPFRPDLGPLIAFGTSLEIYNDFNQDDEYDKLFAGQYKRYKDICMQDTYEEYLYERSVPTF